MNTYHIYLASQSPRRAELLQQIAVEYSVVKADIDETPRLEESPVEYVQRMALEKARAGWVNCDQRFAVLGADTAGVLDDEILCKPKHRNDGLAMLKKLSGRSHQILSAVCLKKDERELLALSQTTVTFRPLSDSEISHYWDSGEAADKAGAYGIQGLAAVFVDTIAGSYSGVVGLPLAETYQLLQQMEQLTGTGKTSI